MTRLKTFARQFDGHIEDADEFAVLVDDFDDLLKLYGGAGDTPPTVGLGLGLRAEALSGRLKPAIIMYVTEEGPDAQSLPARSANGFTIHVESIGKVYAEPPAELSLDLAEGDAFRLAYSPPPGGVSIGILGDGRSGTLGCVVAENGAYYLLSNRHVLDPAIEGKTNQTVLQQSTQDGNRGKTGIAETRYLAALDTARHNLADAGVASLSGVDVDPRILTGAGPAFATLVGPATTVKADDAVMKSGRTTGRTRAFVDAVNVVIPVEFPDAKTYTFAQCISIKQPDGKFQQGGDSGALLVTDGEQPVGLMFAASPTVAFAIPIANVFEALKTASGKDFSIVFKKP